MIFEKKIINKKTVEIIKIPAWSTVSRDMPEGKNTYLIKEGKNIVIFTNLLFNRAIIKLNWETVHI